MLLAPQVVCPVVRGQPTDGFLIDTDTLKSLSPEARRVFQEVGRQRPGGGAPRPRAALASPQPHARQPPRPAGSGEHHRDQQGQDSGAGGAQGGQEAHSGAG